MKECSVIETMTVHQPKKSYYLFCIIPQLTKALLVASKVSIRANDSGMWALQVNHCITLVYDDGRRTFLC